MAAGDDTLVVGELALDKPSDQGCGRYRLAVGVFLIHFKACLPLCQRNHHFVVVACQPANLVHGACGKDRLPLTLAC